MRLVLALLFFVITAESAFTQLINNCRDQPGYFQKEILGYEFSEPQLLVRNACIDNRLVQVSSAHGTGKSHCLVGLILEFMCCPQVWFPDLPLSGFTVRLVATASTNNQIKNVLWKELRRQHSKSNWDLGGCIIDREWQISEDRNCIALSVGDPTSMHGKHSEAMLIIVDEAEGVPREIFQALFSLMTGTRAALVSVYNPVSASGYMAEQSRRPDVWHQVQLSALDHPNVITGYEVIPGAVTRQWVTDTVSREAGISATTPWDEIARNLRDGKYDANPVICARVLGKHPQTGAWQVINASWLQANQEGVTLAKAERGIHAGLDVAAGGLDCSALTVVDKHRNVIHSATLRESDTTKVAAWAWREAKAHGVKKPSHLHVEADGIGKGVVDCLRSKGKRVDAVVMGGKPRGDWRGVVQTAQMLNRRSELWWVARELLRQGGASVAKNYSGIWADLIAPDYTTDAKNRVQIESKDDLRKKLGRSTDEGDSFILALARSGHRSEPGFQPG